MAEEKVLAAAKQVYDTLCEAIENRGWKFERKDQELYVYFEVSGDDIPLSFILAVESERQLIRVISPLPFKMSEEKRTEGAIAVCAASYALLDGNFNYKLSDGKIVFEMTSSFRESLIGEGVFQYMISYACVVVDKYNDLFLALNKGVLSIDDFIKNTK